MSLNFPTSPSNNQIYFDSISGNRYKYNATNNVWFFVANNDIQGSSLDTQVVFNDGNSANGSVGLTFNKTANTLTANTINAFSMRVTGNLYIGSNTVVISNNSISAQTLEVTTMIVGGSAVPTGQQSNSVYDLVNAAFTVANSAYALQNNDYTMSNAAYTVANAAFGLTNTTYAAVNSAFAIINAAYTSSNADYVVTNAAYTVANAAFGTANGKVSKSGDTITGTLSIVGDLVVSGNTYQLNANTMSVSDPLIYLAANNYSSDIVDIGFIANYVNTGGANVHTGLYREHTDKEYYLFQGYDREPINNHIGAMSNNMTLSVLNANIRTSNLNLGGANAIVWIKSAYDTVNAVYTSSNADYVVSNAAFAKANAALANTTGTFAGTLTTTGAVSANGTVYISAADGSLEGGQVTLYGAGAYPNWSIDSYGNNLRILNGNVGTQTVTFGNALGGSNAVNMTVDGSVAIGTTSAPSYRLQVVGSGTGAQIYATSSDSSLSRFGLSNGNRHWTISNYGTSFSPNGGFVIADETAGSARLAIDTAGNVGIGSISPSDPGGDRNLFLRTTANVSIIKSTTTATNASAKARFDWSTGTPNSYAIASLNDAGGNPNWQFSVGPAVTGTYYDSPNHYWRTAAGVGLMRLNSTGNLGIGTVSPLSNRALTINGPDYFGIELTANTTQVARWMQEGTSGGVYFDYGAALQANRFLNIRSASNSVMYIDSAGNVGIGSTTPSTYGGKLSIASTSGSQCSVFFLNPGIGSGQIGFAAASSNFKIYNTYADGLLANGKGIDIDTAGEVGIGTSSPTEKLHVSGGNIYLPASTANTGAIVGSGSSDNFTSAGVIIPHYSLKWAVPNDGGASPAAFLSGYAGVRFYSGGTERVRITSDGSFYIGTAGSSGTYLKPWSANPYYLSVVTGASSAQLVFQRGANNGYGIGCDTNGVFGFWTANNTSATLTNVANFDASGNFGVGTSTPIAQLHVHGTTNIGQRVLSLAPYGANQGGASIIVMGNSDSGGTSGPSVIQSYNRLITFGVGNSHTAAGGGTFTEFMRLDPSGNLGIGNTPNYKLDVSGVINTSDQFRAAGNGGDLRVNGNFGGTIAGIGVVGSNPLMFFTTNTERVRIDASGRFTMSAQPRFKAVFSSATDTTYTINTVLPYNSAVYNVGSHYNASTYRFTAPVAGYYYFRAWGYGTASGGARATMSIRLFKNGTQDTSTVTGDFNVGTNAGEISIAGLNSYGTLYLNSGDYVEAYCTAYNNNSTFRIYTGHAGFEGYLIG
jgi:hypothetical protein